MLWLWRIIAAATVIVLLRWDSLWGLFLGAAALAVFGTICYYMGVVAVREGKMPL